MILHTKTIKKNAVIASATQMAKLYSQAISTFRTIYSSKVVTIAEKNALPAIHDFHNKNAIPLPATLTIILGNKIAEIGEGEKVSLYSPYPFPWRKETGGLTDEFSKKAWAYIEKNKTQPYSEIINENNSKFMRYAIADIMRPSCVACHNSHIDSPKTDWKPGDIRGILDIKIPLDNILSSTKNDLTFTILIYTALAILGLIGLIFEISKHKNETKQLAHAVKERTIELEQEKGIAIKANNAKTEFLSRMSHELRTPLHAVIGFSQLLKLDAKTGSQKENCNEVINASYHLLELINEVLDLSQIESGNLNVRTEEVEIDNILNEAIRLLTSFAEDKGINIDEYITTGYCVYADNTRLKQVFLNLISNAIKYNIKNGTVSVNVVLKKSDTIRINIVDTGLGLDKNQLDNLFTPFERLGAENSHIDGIGIGLTISKQLVELMNGKMGVISKPNEGSTFWVELKCVENKKI